MSLYRKSFSLLSQCIIRHNFFTRVAETRNIHRWVAPTLKELYRRRQRVGPEPERPRSSYLEWNYEAELFAFGKRLNEDFDKNILKRALVQREYSNLQSSQAQDSDSKQLEHNYELINEGEKVINNYILQELNKVYPEVVTNSVLNYLTSQDMLAHIGKHIGLRDIVLTNEFPVSDETLSNTFKAIVAALKRSTDLPQAEKFVKDFVLTQLSGKDIIDIWNPENPYEYLSKVLKEKGIESIEPRLCNQSASNTILACFQVGLFDKKKLLGIGWGENIKIAKEAAALDALQKLYNTNKSVN